MFTIWWVGCIICYLPLLALGYDKDESRGFNCAASVVATLLWPLVVPARILTKILR
jgi:hypothetical protein